MKNKTKNNAASANIYGFHAVREAWLNPAREIDFLYITQNSMEGFRGTLEDARRAGLKRPDPTVLEKKAFDKLLLQSAVHQGVALVAQDLEEVNVQDLIIRAGAGDSLLLILDQITDPHNVGAILRSAAALGADGIVMQRKYAPSLEGVLAKTASGAVEHIPVAYETNLSRAIEALKEGGFFVYGLDERGEDIGAMKPGGKVALVLGAEGAGLRRLVKENCDALLRIPMSGSIESLNVSNAAAIALYALKK